MSGAHQAVFMNQRSFILSLQLWTWGGDTQGFSTTANRGQLGHGDDQLRSSPVQVGSLTNWKQASGGAEHCLAVKSDGTLWAWGGNVYGQLGQQNTIPRSSPVQVGALTNWEFVKAGGVTSFAITTDGALYVWGGNYNGQLGIGDRVSKSSPTQVGALTTWRKVETAFSGGSVLATKTDGTLWAWGRNQTGELGLNNTVRRSSPVQVGALTHWADIGGLDVSNYQSFAATTTSGTLFAWGANNQGQLGQGNRIDRSFPVQVGALTAWASVGPTGSAIKTDGTLWTWGNNNDGTLGQNNNINRSSPVQVGALTTWKQITGATFKIAVTTDGKLFAWGSNRYGHLGNGNAGDSFTNPSVSSPVQVGALTTWSSVGSTANRYSPSIALKTP